MKTPSQTPPIVQFRTWKLIGWAIGAIILVLGLIFAVMLWLGAQIKQSEFTPDKTVRQIIIGNDILDIPSNHIRFSQQRQKSVLDQIEIVFLLPRGEGYSTENREQFRDTSKSNNLIFVSLLKRKMAEDMSGRLTLIYERLFDGTPKSGPAELVLHELKQGAGYDNEVLAVHYGEDFTWVARCQNEAENVAPTCLRDINIGESLSARYRFSLLHLDEWREVEAIVRAKVSKFLLR